ncbi:MULTISPECIES: class I SAM-dependent methyltransferase [unclassified Wenzhouxiangella]|uniref:class I SAM-dependent methyltransferase n=1 Tax=unclassified Wenzhouxiangella TaxID=2613841 RepID=UPI0011C02839|nr:MULTISPECIES: methyltransferase domain-containing protein [unclassified Wenzhouxiangella]
MLKATYRRLKKSIWTTALRAYVSTKNSYQPLGEDKAASGGRPTEAFQSRWRHVKSEIESCGAQNLVDIGCAQGWFVRNACIQCNLFSIGLDIERSSLRLGSAYAELQGEKGYGFVAGAFTPTTIERLPTFDIVVCFSLVHHIIKEEGRMGGLEYLKACRKITKKRFLFDIGGPEELSHWWVSKLDFLKGDLEANLHDYLAEAGFTDIRKIGESLAHEDKIMRPLFACSP